MTALMAVLTWWPAAVLLGAAMHGGRDAAGHDDTSGLGALWAFMLTEPLLLLISLLLYSRRSISRVQAILINVPLLVLAGWLLIVEFRSRGWS